jgi:hypothetical protein
MISVASAARPRARSKASSEEPLWEEDGVALLLQGAETKAEAIRVAAEVSR